MIKAILFDYDGVISANSNAGQASERLARRLTIDPKEINKLFMTLWPDYIRGNISDEDLWQKVEQGIGRPVVPEQRDIWLTWEQLKPLPQIVAFVKELKTSGYGVGLLSNVTPTTQKELQAHGFYDGFDFLVLSCQAGFAKPDPQIYKLALQHLPGVSPHEVIFIDDREACLEPAKKIGMHTILATSPQQIINDVRANLAHL